jgi:nitrate reductase NapE
VTSEPDHATPISRRDELTAFLLLTIVMAPILAVAIVGGYGFAVWMMQLVNGPPGAG